MDRRSFLTFAGGLAAAVAVLKPSPGEAMPMAPAPATGPLVDEANPAPETTRWYWRRRRYRVYRRYYRRRYYYRPRYYRPRYYRPRFYRPWW